MVNNEQYDIVVRKGKKRVLTRGRRARTRDCAKSTYAGVSIEGKRSTERR